MVAKKKEFGCVWMVSLCKKVILDQADFFALVQTQSAGLRKVGSLLLPLLHPERRITFSFSSGSL